MECKNCLRRISGIASAGNLGNLAVNSEELSIISLSRGQKMLVNELIRVDPGIPDVQPNGSWHARLQDIVEGITQASPLNSICGEFSTFDFSGARIYFMHSGIQRITRTRPSPRNRFAPMAIIPMDGAPLSITQAGRNCKVGVGQFALIDAAAPLDLDYTGEFHQLYLNFPSSSFIPAVFHRAIARSFDPQSDFDETFIKLVKAVWRNAENLRPEEHCTALNSILSLCNLITPFRETAWEVEPCIRVRRAMTYIEQNLTEAWLTPTKVASAQGISRRYLDDLFGKIELRIESWIWERRLLRAREELELAGRAQSGRGKTIINIALDAGFKSPSHFSRSFNGRFGVSPREYRNKIGRERIQ